MKLISSSIIASVHTSILFLVVAAKPEFFVIRNINVVSPVGMMESGWLCSAEKILARSGVHIKFSSLTSISIFLPVHVHYLLENVVFLTEVGG